MNDASFPHLFVKGSSGIQIVANLQPRVKSLINYVRGKTWISATFISEKQSELSGGKETMNCKFSFIHASKGFLTYAQ
jgi:cation diffusion facilitator CzcD-associated flavoprotein CzcO